MLFIMRLAKGLLPIVMPASLMRIFDRAHLAVLIALQLTI